MRPLVFKENGKPQHIDVALNTDIAVALAQKVLAGEPIFTKEPYLLLTDKEGNTQELSAQTVHSWISRNNVIPETGQTLRDVLDAAREDFRHKQFKARQEAIVEDAERQLHRTLKLRTNLPVIGLTGVLKDAKGKIIRRENSKLLQVKMHSAHYALERLNPQRYGKVDRTESKHLVFSLSDLRKAKEAMRQ